MLKTAKYSEKTIFQISSVSDVKTVTENNRTFLANENGEKVAFTTAGDANSYVFKTNKSAGTSLARLINGSAPYYILVN